MFSLHLKVSKEFFALDAYGSLFQRRGEAIIKARSPAVKSFVLDVSNLKLSFVDLVHLAAYLDVINSVRYFVARLLMHL